MLLLSLDSHLWQFPYHFFRWKDRLSLEHICFQKWIVWLFHLFIITRDYQQQIFVDKSIYDYIQNHCPSSGRLVLFLGIAPSKDFAYSISSRSSFYWVTSYVRFERENMQPRASVGDGLRISASSTPGNSSGGYEPDDLESLGDVYIWGQILTDDVSPDRTIIQAPTKIDTMIPKLVESKNFLDVRHIASGAHHIAIVTRQGEVFTWGEESGGRLGHGIDKDFGHPHPVKFIGDINFDFVACGEYHTSVVSRSCELYMWGDGTHNIGLLGHGNETSHWIPKRVNGPLEGLQVVSIACGTWHSALATSDGKLFTFGDGTFGVLGHGDQESVLYPKEVQLLNGLKTIKVSCGVWHTAAIVDVSFQSSSNASSWKLFTWGDGDKYRLGHGNKETYLTPTRVSPLMEYNFHQVVCGHTMTVALTTSGHVFTMGGTENGQLGNPMSVGKIPTLVQDKLLGEYVEEISCGAHHVATLTSRSELYTWGMGANGRLGHGDIEDRKSPTLVVALKDMQIKKISCGSNFTACICIHKWITGTDQSICSSCRQAFGLTRIRHNCHNCGLIFCHACSSRKALKAALSPTPEKPHRVCDNCYAKLKLVENGFAPKSESNSQDSSINGIERLGQSAIKSTTLFSPITKPVTYQNNKLGIKYDSTSFVQVSQVPSRLQLKDVAFSNSLSSTKNILMPNISPIPSQTLLPPANTTRQSLPCSHAPRFSGSLIDGLRRTNVSLNHEVSKLQKQVQSLKQKSDMQDMEIQKLQKKTTEATALAAVESSNHRETKEYIKSTLYQMKEMTEKLPEEISQSKDLIVMLTQVEDFLNEIPEAECVSSLPPKFESMYRKKTNIFPLDNRSSNLQKYRLEENDVVEVDRSQDGVNFVEKSNVSKLQSKLQNTIDVHALDTSNSKLHEHGLEENVGSSEVDPFEDEENLLEESNGSKLESGEGNLPAETNISKRHNTPHMLPSSINTPKFSKSRLEENNDSLEAGHSKAGGSNVGATMPPQNLENGSRSLDASRTPSQNLEKCSISLGSSKLGRQGSSILEKFESGVYALLTLQPDGIKVFKQIKFSKRRFTPNQAEEWWNENKDRVFRKYCPSQEKLIIGSSNVTLQTKENIGILPS